MTRRSALLLALSPLLGQRRRSSNQDIRVRGYYTLGDPWPVDIPPEVLRAVSDGKRHFLAYSSNPPPQPGYCRWAVDHKQVI